MQRDFTITVGIYDGVISAVLRDVNIGILLLKVELAKLTAFIKADCMPLR